METNGRWKEYAKGLVALILTLIATGLMLTRDWAFMFRESAVSAERVNIVERQIGEVKAEYVRKDVLEPRLVAVEKDLREMREEFREERKQTNQLLQQILWEQRRK